MKVIFKHWMLFYFKQDWIFLKFPRPLANIILAIPKSYKMPSYKIKHITRYSYSSPVIDCTNQIMLYPIIDAHLEVRNHEIKISAQSR